MRLFDDEGRELEADFDIEASDVGVDVVLHSRAGGTKGRGSRNSAYNEILELLLRRLSQYNVRLVSAAVDSSVARRRPPSDRLVDLEYPIRLSERTDAHDLRVRLTEGQRTVASAVPVESRAGNKHKRLRLRIDLADADLKVADVPNVLRSRTTAPASLTLGAAYRRAVPNPSVRASDLFAVDSARLERSLAAHAAIQNGLAEHLSNLGFAPRSPGAGEPDFDLAWVQPALVVAEVKSLGGTDPVQQLRLGLGQVLHYRRLLSDVYGPTSAVLAVEYEPPREWFAVCADAAVVVTWPPLWPGVPLT